MATRRLNDTSAIRGIPLLQNEDHSISVRQIDNGYITRTSHNNPQTGEYRCAETFSASEPRIIPGRAARQWLSPAAGASPLKDTMEYLSDKDGVVSPRPR